MRDPALRSLSCCVSLSAHSVETWDFFVAHPMPKRGGPFSHRHIGIVSIALVAEREDARRMVDAEGLVARIEAAKRSIEDNRAALLAAAEAIGASIDAHGAASAEAEDLSEQLAVFGIEDRARLALDVHDTLDGSEATTVDWKQTVESKIAEADIILAILDEALANAKQLGGESGGNAAAPPNQQGAAALPAGCEPSGGKLLEQSRESDEAKRSRRARLLRQAMTKVDDVHDSVSTVADNLTVHFPDPPPKETTAMVSVPVTTPEAPHFVA